MSVVLRCPNCGTTRGAPGECEACHEAQVRYFCTDHSPGLWLNVPTCPKCGGRFGDSPRRAAAAPSVPPSSVSARPRAPGPVAGRAPESSRPSRGPSPRPSARPDPPDIPADEWIDGRKPAIGGEDFEVGASPLAPWQRILGAVLRARALRTRAAFGRDRPSIGRSTGGCLTRLLVLALLLFLGLLVAVFGFGRALFQGLQPY